MPRSRALRSGAIAVLAILLGADCASAQRRREATAPPSGPDLVSRISAIKEGGGRLDWLGDRIAFDMLGADRTFDVYTMRPDGSGERCLTCNHPELPNKDMGQPAWHPSGRLLVLQAEKAKHLNVRFRHLLTPGAGRLNDLWSLDLDTNRVTLLREVPDTRESGTLHPHFSADGNRLSWTELQGKGRGWALMVADFRVDRGRPRLENVRSYAPGGRGFYENHGFSPDGTRLIYTSDVDSKLLHFADIYVMDLRTEKATRLASDGYNEHAVYSPDGRYIAWISTVGNRRGGTDYWIMNADGSNRRRLTYFNQKGHPHYVGKKVIVADLSWRSDGAAFAGYYREGGPIEAKSDRTKIILVELRLDAVRRGGSGGS